MQLNFSSTSLYHLDTTTKTQVPASHVNERSTNFSNENNLNTIEQKNLVENYFKIFDENYSEVTIKNLITARLQPTSVLPQVHNIKELSAKSEELLDFSLSV